MRKATEERYQEILRLVRAGKTNREIAETLCCSRSTVDRVIALYGGRKKHEHFSDHSETVIEMYGRGVVVEKIAEETGLSASTIRRNLREQGVSRGRGWKPADYKQQTRDGIYAREQEQEPVPVYQVAPETRKTERIVIRGKIYTDVSAWYL